MVFKRVNLWLSVACLVAVVGFADATASAAPAADKGPKLTAVVTVKSITSADVGIQTRCEITSRNGNFYYQQWCETQAVWITWYWGNSLIGYDDLIIDVFGPVMHDLGGWVQLQGGVATTSQPGQNVGIFILNSSNPVKIAVIGTDNARWCNTTGSPWSWSGWSHC